MEILKEKPGEVLLLRESKATIIKGGFYFRVPKLIKFIELLESKEGEVVGIRFEKGDKYYAELLVGVKDEDIKTKL